MFTPCQECKSASKPCTMCYPEFEKHRSQLVDSIVKANRAIDPDACIEASLEQWAAISNEERVRLVEEVCRLTGTRLPDTPLSRGCSCRMCYGWLHNMGLIRE